MPFDATDVVLLAVVAVFVGWALRSMVRALRTDAARRELLVDLAAEHGLREKEAVGPRSAADVTVESLARRWSRNPALADPPRGSRVLEGTLDGLPFVVDEVWVRKWWSSLRDAHLRMAVELPGLPKGLSVFPAGRIRRLVRRVKPGAESGYPGRRSRIAVSFSRRAEERVQEELFLTPHRRQVLEDRTDGAGDAYLCRGRLFLIRPWKATGKIDLARQVQEIGLLARRLVGHSMP